MKPEPLAEEYFHLFEQQLEACSISDPKKHAEQRKRINQQIHRCLKELKQQAESSGPDAWYALGHAATYYDKDSQKATQWYQRAADAGHTQAITKLANRLRQSSNSTDQEQASNLLNQAAENGDAYAMLSMGIAYRDGQGPARNYTLAKSWFAKAEEANDPAAARCLADLYLHHLQRPELALPYYLKAEKQGLNCNDELAQIYNTRGSGIYNPIKAKEHYEVLLRRGKKSAPWVMLELAKLHASGQVSENGVTHARKWLYQIITQCPKTLSARKKAERLLAKLDESLF